MSETPSLGLSKAEVEEKKRQGLVNQTDQSSSRSLADIIQSNFLSVANVTLLAIVFILLSLGKISEAFATGGVVIVNVFLGAYQEYRAKIKLDQIALLTRPKVRVIREGTEQEIDQAAVVVGDAIVLHAGDQAVVDGRLIVDPRSDNNKVRVDMDESLLTGESDLIAKYPDDEILSGSFCVVGKGVFIAEKVGDEAFAQKLTKGARQFTVTQTPLQLQISIVVRLLVVVALALSMLLYLRAAFNDASFAETVEDTAVAVSLIPQGLLLMITVAYAIGALRIAQQGALVQQSNAVESMSHVNVLCLDKTGTLTTNRILYNDVHPLKAGYDAEKVRHLLGDYIAAAGSDNRTAEAIAEAIHGTKYSCVVNIPFSSKRKWAAVSFENDTYQGTFVLGAPGMMLETIPFSDQIKALAQEGLRVLLFAHSPEIIRDVPENEEPGLPANIEPIALVSLSDELRPGVNDVLDSFREIGIMLKLISGDNPTTVGALARKAGFTEDDKEISGMELAKLNELEFERAVHEYTIFGRITPEQKEAIVDVLRKNERYVAMMGDGVNDVLSLKKAQIGIAMEDGSQATRSVADIVLLGNKFEALPHAFSEGQRILNGMNDVNRLFLTRTFYTVLLIIIAGYIGTDFPFTPLHNLLLTSLPVGIPAFFLTTWARAGQPQDNLISSLTRFVFPAGMSFTFATAFIWILYNSSNDADFATSQSVLTTAGLVGGLWIVMLAEQDGGYKIQWQDRRRIGLALSMFVLFLVIMAIPTLREFFDMTTLSWADIGIIAAIMSLWAIALDLIWRFELVGRLLIPNYGKPSAPKVSFEVE